MKKIYTFTLDDEVPSDELFNDVKVIAHLLYDELKNEEYDTKILVTTDKHKENVLYETKVMNDYQYKFLSEIENDSKALYEPFLINHIGFGITIYDGSIPEPLLNYLFKNVLNTIRKPYNFSISSIVLDASPREELMIRKNIEKNHSNNASYITISRIGPILKRIQFGR